MTLVLWKLGRRGTKRGTLIRINIFWPSHLSMTQSGARAATFSAEQLKWLKDTNLR